MRIKLNQALPFAAMSLFFLAGCGGNTTQSSSTSPTSQSSSANTPGTTTTGLGPASATSGIPHASHVALIIEENQSFATVFNNQMPYLSSLATTYAYAAKYTSTNGGSMLNYLMLSSGDDETKNGCEGWGCPNQLTKPLTDDNIFRELTKAGLTWKVYAESLPQTGYLLDGPSPYVNRHNPAVWYTDIVNSKTMQQNIVPFTELAKDLANNTLPNYILIIPNLNHDAHDGSPKQADDWLASNVKPLMSSTAFGPNGDSLMFITFDECGGGTNDGCGAHVMTTVIGPRVKHGFVSQAAYSHPDLLRTIMDALGVHAYPGKSAKAKDMTDFF